MALTLTALKTIRMGGGVRLHLGTLACDSAGDSSTIKVTGPNPLSFDAWMEGDGADWEKAPIQVSYSTSGEFTTFTVTCQSAVTTGKYQIMVL